MYSFRNQFHQWDPKNQRPELWNVYNSRINKGESIRVFPLSNWTELDIWQYIHREQIPLVPLYFAAERPVVVHDGQIIMVDDERMRLGEGERPEEKMVRFRTLGCYPLTGAVESRATTLPEIIQELAKTVDKVTVDRVSVIDVIRSCIWPPDRKPPNTSVSSMRTAGSCSGWGRGSTAVASWPG